MRRLVAAVLPVSLLAASCGDRAASDPGSVSAVASVYPLAWMAEQVAPDAQVSLLSAGGPEAHDLELTPAQRQAIETADVMLFVGEIGYQPQVEEAVASTEGETVSLSQVAGRQRLLKPGENPHAHEEEGEDHTDGDDADQPQVQGAAVDPHLWFDPSVMADAAIQAGDAFAAADPDDAATYRANAETLRSELAALEGELDDVLGGECTHGEVIVSHQAYGYLLAPYGHAQRGVTGINPEAGASSGELAELVEEIEAEGFAHVLTEPVEGRAGAETVAREAGVELLEIVPLDAVSEAQAELGFVDLLRAQATQLAIALGCRGG